MSALLPFKRHWGKLVASLTVLLLVALAVKSAGSFVSTPTQRADSAELIVALGGDGGSRILEAGRLFAKGYAPRILLTGIDHGDPETRPVYLSWRAEWLVKQGVPDSALLYDRRSSNSWMEARNTRALMEKMGWKRVLVVSDPPHMRRLSWVWENVFAESGLEYRIIASPMPDWDADHWWNNEKSAQFVLMEVIKLGYYTLNY